jgi:hypothetical protein
LYLYTNGNTDGDKENGNSKFVKDTHGTVDMAEDLLAKQVLGQDWQHSSNVNDVQEGDGCDHCSHKRLQFMSSSGKKKKQVSK